MTTCSIPQCGRQHRARGFCENHYARFRRHGDPLGGEPDRAGHGEPIAWLDAHVGYDKDDCLIWPFSRMNGALGKLWFDGVLQPTNRVMCIKAKGPPPSPRHLAVLTCGNGLIGCCNPKHIIWKISKELAADRIIHDVHNRGERNGQVKLSSDQVLAIRSLTGRKYEEIASQFGVSESTIGEIMRREIWAWL